MKKHILRAATLVSIVILTSCTSPDISGLSADNDGHLITVVTIGTQKWSQKNLDVSKYRNGDVIPEVTDPTAWAALTTGAWCYYANDPANGLIYGRLYNWYAVNDPRGLASVGWHVANETDWTALITNLGGDALAGGKMKEMGTTHWTSPNAAADNSSGFTGLPGGYNKEIGQFNDLGVSGYFWSSTEHDPTNAWTHSLGNMDGIAYISFSNKGAGYSVRCVKD